MYFKKLKKLLSGILVGAMMLTSISAMPVMAASDLKINVENVTTEANTLMGEVRFKISLTGVKQKMAYAQVGIKFNADADGNGNSMAFKDVEPIHKVNNAIDVLWQEGNHLVPGVACANNPKSPTNGEIDLFIVTFDDGEAGIDKVAVTLDLESSEIGLSSSGNSFSESLPTNNNNELTYEGTASQSTTVPAKTNITVSMDNVEGYGNTSNDNPITLTLTNTTTDRKYVALLTSTEYRTNYVFNEDVIKGTYNLELKGNGYKTYIKEGITDIEAALEISNDDFMPGDVDGNDEINFMDYVSFMALVDNKIANSFVIADFNRDKSIDGADLKALCNSLKSEVTVK